MLAGKFWATEGFLSWQVVAEGTKSCLTELFHNLYLMSAPLSNENAHYIQKYRRT
jgi:hypothetical protein